MKGPHALIRKVVLKKSCGIMLAFLIALLILPFRTANATSTVHFYCEAISLGNQGSIYWSPPGITYSSGQTASYPETSYTVTGNPPSSGWFFAFWSVAYLGSPSWVDNSYSPTTTFHLNGEAWLWAYFYSPIHANNPTTPTTWGTRQRITGTAGSCYNSEPLTISYYPQGSGMGPPKQDGTPPFGGSGYYWTTVTVNSGSWDTGLIYPTLPISLGHQLPQTYEVYAIWGDGAMNEVDSNVVSFTINPGTAQIGAPTLNPSGIELGESVSITGQIFSSDFVNSNDMTGTLTVQTREQGEPSWTNVASQAFTSNYGYSSIYGEWGVFYDFSKLWTPTETGIYDVRVTYSGNNLYNPLVNPPSSTLTVGEANNPPSTPSTPEWIGDERILTGTPTQNEGFRSGTTDPDGEDIQITFDWGDGHSDTTGWLPSGTDADEYHSWTDPGMFEVKTKAVDSHDPPAQSDWSSASEVTVVTNSLQDIWAGYMVQSSTQPIESVEGYWTIPNFGTELHGIHGIWVGIGGNGPGSELLQAGIMVVTTPEFGVWMRAFWERVPDSVSFEHRLEVDFTWGHDVYAGDLIWAEVSESSATPGMWRIEVSDLSQGWTWSVDNIDANPDQTTGEWIFEPGAGPFGGTNVVSDFTAIPFSNAELEINSNLYDMGKVDQSLNSNLFIWNCERLGVVCTEVSPIDNFDSFEITDTGLRPSTLVPVTSISLFSSAQLHVHDSLNRHLGYNSTTGLVDLEIPNSIYFEDADVQHALLFCYDEHQVTLIGTENGDFHLNTQNIVNSTVVFDNWVNETIAINETITYYLIHQIGLDNLLNSKTIVGQEYECFMNVTIFNNGNYTENFNVTVYVNVDPVDFEHVTLDAGESSNVTFVWDTLGFTFGNFSISIAAEIVSGETYTEDNLLTDVWILVTIAGDLDGDKTVNILDAIRLGAAYSCAPQDSNWNANADINSDNVVDILDAIILASHFRETWS